MLTVDELLEKVGQYQRKNFSLEEFENWFEDNSTGAYAVPDLRQLCAAVDAALAEYHFDYVGEAAFRQELASAVRPFALGKLKGICVPVASSDPQGFSFPDAVELLTVRSAVAVQESDFDWSRPIPSLAA